MTLVVDKTTRFQGYEIHRVVEYMDAHGESYCEQLTFDRNIEDERNSPEYVTDFWTLYGRMVWGGVDAIADFDSEEKCLSLLYQITGIEGKVGESLFPLKVWLTTNQTGHQIIETL